MTQMAQNIHQHIVFNELRKLIRKKIVEKGFNVG